MTILLRIGRCRDSARTRRRGWRGGEIARVLDASSTLASWRDWRRNWRKQIQFRHHAPARSDQICHKPLIDIKITENRAAAGHSSSRRAEAPSPPVRLLVPGEPGEVDVFFYRSMKAARIGPHDVGPSHCVHGEPHVIAEESCLDWIVRDDEIGHRRRRDAVVTDCCRAGGWTLDGRQRDVVAATGLAVAV